MQVSERSIELAVVALESAAQACQSGASLRNERGLDPLAREYLVAADQMQNTATLVTRIRELADQWETEDQQALDPQMRVMWPSDALRALLGEDSE